MDLEDDPEINLHIPLKPVYEEFVCPICFSTIEECMTTTCGHSFCGECIKECLNRKHQCPCCNAATTVKELFRNLHADRLIAIMNTEKDKASKLYFDALLNPNKDPAGGGSSAGNAAAASNQGALSPIEQVFHQHMKKSLLSYEEYHKSLRQKYERGLEALQAEISAKMVKAKEENKGAAADAAIAKLKGEFDERRAAMEASFTNTEKFVVDQYAKFVYTPPSHLAPEPLHESNPDPAPFSFLEKTVVSVQFLPVQVFITVSKRDGIKIPYVVKPTDTPKDLKETLRQHFEKLGDPVKEFGPKNYFLLKRPYGKGKQAKGDDDMDVDDAGEEVKIKDDDTTIIQLRPEPGSILCLRGKLQMRSEEPKKCLKSTFDPQTVEPMDYFTCKTCKLNWLCKSCSESCHVGHEIVIYLKQHKPNWACCYCFKNNCCKLYKNITKCGSQLRVDRTVTKSPLGVSSIPSFLSQ